MLWWVITAIVLVLVLFPIVSLVDDYPLLFTNVLFVVVFITFARLIFLTKHSFLDNYQALKLAVIFTALPVIFLLIEQLMKYHKYVDEIGLDTFMTALSADKQASLSSYIHMEMMLFGIGAIFAAVLFPFRMVRSIWLKRNTVKD